MICSSCVPRRRSRLPLGALFAASLVVVAVPPLAEGQATRRMSVTSAEVEVGADSQFQDCDSTGRRVVFSSHSPDLVPGDTNFAWDIFVRDQKLGTTTRVNLTDNGVEANSDSFYPSISDDGRYVAYESRGSNLVIGDNNDVSDVFVVDLVTGVTVRASVNDLGAEGNGESTGAHLSGDGRFVTFQSRASDLVRGDTNGVADIFVHDLVSRTTVRVNIAVTGAQADADSSRARLNFNGRFLVFASNATNLVGGDTNGFRDIFYCDLTNNGILRVSQAGAIQGDGDSDRPDIDAFGDQVVFESRANNLLAEDLNAGHDIFLKRISTDALELISLSNAGASVHGAAVDPTIDASGDTVAFTSYSSLLVNGDTNGERDIFTRERSTATTLRVSVNSNGDEGRGWSDFCQISGDGLAVAYHSTAPDLVSGDANGRTDVFLHGQWLRLDLDPPILYEFNPFEIYCYGGDRRGLLLLQIIAVNGSPFVFNLGFSKFSSEGLYSFGGTTPPGLSGIWMDLLLFGVADDGQAHASNVARMRFR